VSAIDDPRGAATLPSQSHSLPIWAAADMCRNPFGSPQIALRFRNCSEKAVVESNENPQRTGRRKAPTKHSGAHATGGLDRSTDKRLRAWVRHTRCMIHSDLTGPPEGRRVNPGVAILTHGPRLIFQWRCDLCRLARCGSIHSWWRPPHVGPGSSAGGSSRQAGGALWWLAGPVD
jgi:hypothetical protein